LAAVLAEYVRQKLGGFMQAKHLGPEKRLSKFAHVCGTPCWGGIIKARDRLWRPGPDRYLWGMVLLAPGAPPEIAFGALTEVLNRIDDLPDDGGALSAELSSFLNRVLNPQVSLSAVPVPQALSPDLKCLVADCVFDRDGLPDGFLKRALLPTLWVGDTSYPPHAFALHQKHWPKSYRALWRAYPSGDSEKTEALHVTGLPADVLDDFEEKILQLCEEHELTNLFLNVGYVREAGEQTAPKDATGDLTFLGLASQRAEVERYVKALLAAELDAETLAGVEMQVLNEEQFASRFGAVFDMLQNQS
jgi:hypothetical protein